MSFNPSLAQIPNEAILDAFNKQTYLGNSFISSTNSVTLTNASTEYPLFLLTNPVSNSNIGAFLNIRKLSQLTNVSTATTIFNLYLSAVVTNAGSAMTPVNLRPWSGKSSIMTVGKSPTVSGNGTYCGTIAVNYQQIDSDVLFIIDPGYNFFITANTDIAGTKVNAEVIWNEI